MAEMSMHWGVRCRGPEGDGLRERNTAIPLLLLNAPFVRPGNTPALS